MLQTSWGKFVECFEEASILEKSIVERQTAVAEQQAEILALLFEKIKPVMMHVNYPVAVRYYYSGKQFDIPRYNYYKEWGIILIDEFEEDYVSRDARGEYTGARLVLTGSGKLVNFTRSGCWSKLQGEPSTWEAMDEIITSSHAIGEYDFADIILALVTTFNNVVKIIEEKQAILGKSLAILEEIKSLLSCDDQG